MRARKKYSLPVESLDMCDEEEIGFVEGDVDFGKAIASFSFGSENEVSNKALEESDAGISNLASADLKKSGEKEVSSASALIIQSDTESCGISFACSGTDLTVPSAPVKGWIATPCTQTPAAANNRDNESIMFKGLSSASVPSFSSSKASGIGSTPMIDSEAFSIKRGYQFRPSTIRKLHELRALHPDINAYINTIIDEAITHYYNCVLSQRKN